MTGIPPMTPTFRLEDHTKPHVDLDRLLSKLTLGGASKDKNETREVQTVANELSIDFDSFILHSIDSELLDGGPMQIYYLLCEVLVGLENYLNGLSDDDQNIKNFIINVINAVSRQASDCLARATGNDNLDLPPPVVHSPCPPGNPNLTLPLDQIFVGTPLSSPIFCMSPINPNFISRTPVRRTPMGAASNHPFTGHGSMNLTPLNFNSFNFTPANQSPVSFSPMNHILTNQEPTDSSSMSHSPMIPMKVQFNFAPEIEVLENISSDNMVRPRDLDLIPRSPASLRLTISSPRDPISPFRFDSFISNESHSPFGSSHLGPTPIDSSPFKRCLQSLQKAVFLPPPPRTRRKQTRSSLSTEVFSELPADAPKSEATRSKRAIHQPAESSNTHTQSGMSRIGKPKTKKAPTGEFQFDEASSDDAETVTEPDSESEGEFKSEFRDSQPRDSQPDRAETKPPAEPVSDVKINHPKKQRKNTKAYRGTGNAKTRGKNSGKVSKICRPVINVDSAELACAIAMRTISDSGSPSIASKPDSLDSVSESNEETPESIDTNDEIIKLTQKFFTSIDELPSEYVRNKRTLSLKSMLKEVNFHESSCGISRHTALKLKKGLNYFGLIYPDGNLHCRSKDACCKIKVPSDVQQHLNLSDSTGPHIYRIMVCDSQSIKNSKYILSELMICPVNKELSIVIGNDYGRYSSVVNFSQNIGRKKPEPSCDFIWSIVMRNMWGWHSIQIHDMLGLINFELLKIETRWACNICGEVFNTSLQCMRHAPKHVDTNILTCEFCLMDFSRVDAFQRHATMGRCISK